MYFLHVGRYVKGYSQAQKIGTLVSGNGFDVCYPGVWYNE